MTNDTSKRVLNVQLVKNVFLSDTAHQWTDVAKTTERNIEGEEEKSEGQKDRANENTLKNSVTLMLSRQEAYVHTVC